MMKILRTGRGHWRRLSPYSSKLRIFGTSYISPLTISYINFLVLFAPSSYVLSLVYFLGT
jgi:hypothetical protein